VSIGVNHDGEVEMLKKRPRNLSGWSQVTKPSLQCVLQEQSNPMIDTILDACREVLEINGDPQSPYWLESQMMEMRLWRASEHDVRAALEQDISERRERSLFVKASDDEWALRSWKLEGETDD
jgi:hypothetical protein